MRDPVLAAIGVRALAPNDTAACLQAAGRILKPTMNDLAVVRRGLEPDRMGTFKDKYGAPRQRESPGRRKPDHACTDYHAFDLVQLPASVIIYVKPDPAAPPLVPASMQPGKGLRCEKVIRTRGDRV